MKGSHKHTEGDKYSGSVKGEREGRGWQEMVRLVLDIRRPPKYVALRFEKTNTGAGLTGGPKVGHLHLVTEKGVIALQYRVLDSWTLPTRAVSRDTVAHLARAAQDQREVISARLLYRFPHAKHRVIPRRIWLFDKRYQTYLMRHEGGNLTTSSIVLWQSGNSSAAV